MQEKRKKLLNIAIIILLDVLAVLIAVEYTLGQYLFSTFTAHEIHEFTFKDVAGYTTKDGKIFDNDQHDLAYLPDTLRFDLTLQNVVYPSKVVIQPKLTISSDSGVDPEIITITNFDLNPKESYTIDQLFKPVDEGINHASLEIQVFNYTTGTKIVDITNTTSFKVQSVDASLLAEANQVSSRNFAASLLIGIVTAIALGSTAIISYMHTKELRESNRFLKTQTETAGGQMTALNEQNRLYRDQFSLLNRPWISISDKENGFAHTPFKFIVFLQNYGKTPAVEIKTKYLVKDGSITVDELKRDGKPADTADMTPDEIWSEDLEMPNPDYAKMLSTNNYHFGLYIEYKYENTKKGITTIIGQIKNAGREISFKTKDLK